MGTFMGATGHMISPVGWIMASQRYPGLSPWYLQMTPDKEKECVQMKLR